MPSLEQAPLDNGLIGVVLPLLLLLLVLLLLLRPLRPRLRVAVCLG